MSAKKQKAKKRSSRPEKPLTLSVLVHYNNKVLLPTLELRFATKQDLNEFKTEMHEFKTEMYEFKTETIASFNDIEIKLNNIADTLDHILKNTEDLNQEHTMQINANQRVDKKLDNHEKRIIKLEATAKAK